MPIPRFDYFAPRTVDEAVNLLAQAGPDGRVMAGGTDLLVKIRFRVIHPAAIVGLKKIEGLERISFSRNKGLTIGATALLADVAASSPVRRYYPGVAQAADQTANVQVRNMGTVVGNLCNASPSADNAPTLLALGARVRITGPGGQRSMSLEDFFRGPGMTALEPGEIVTAVTVPLPPPRSATAYLSLSARAKLDCSAVGVGVMLALDDRDRCKDLRIFVGACAPIPVRAGGAEQVLIGEKLTDSTVEQAALEAAKATQPIDDVRASADYRYKMATVLTIRAIMDARKRALRKKN